MASNLHQDPDHHMARMVYLHDNALIAGIAATAGAEMSPQDVVAFGREVALEVLNQYTFIQQECEVFAKANLIEPVTH